MAPEKFMVRWASLILLRIWAIDPINFEFQKNCSVLYCHDPAGETQCSKRWMQIATHVPTSENKLPPLWNMKKRNFALISSSVKVKAP